MDILSNKDVGELSLTRTFSTKDLRTDVLEIGVEWDMTVLHALKCEKSSLVAKKET